MYEAFTSWILIAAFFTKGLKVPNRRLSPIVPGILLESTWEFVNRVRSTAKQDVNSAEQALCTKTTVQHTLQCMYMLKGCMHGMLRCAVQVCWSAQIRTLLLQPKGVVDSTDVNELSVSTLIIIV